MMDSKYGQLLASLQTQNIEAIFSASFHIDKREKQLPQSKAKNKYYKARLIDLRLKHIEKEQKQLELQIEGLLPGPLSKEEREESLKANATGKIEELFQALGQYQQDPTFNSAISSSMRSTCQVALGLRTKLNQSKAALMDEKAKLGLTEAEKTSLYKNIEALYQEQVQNRPWYLHDIVGYISMIIPPLYFLWKDERNKEAIQLNPHDETQKKISRNVRQSFKKHINTLEGMEGAYITKKGKGGHYDAPPPKYITTFKMQRNAFFEKHKEWYRSVAPKPDFFEQQEPTSPTKFSPKKKYVEQQDIDWILKSKEEDQELRLNLGIR